MQLAESEIEELTRTVFVTVAGMDIASESGAVGEETRTFSVDVEGAWCGTIRIAIGDALARRIAAAMLAMEDPDEADIADAMCELANIIGGNVKGLVPGPSRLSLPQTNAVVRGSLIQRQCFTTDGDAFCVSVFSATEGAGSPS